MDQGLKVVLMQKMADGSLQQIEERTWSSNMVKALDSVNYIVVGETEYETVEGRLNLNLDRLELLVVPMNHSE
ncbi:hypothetical protein [Paenibacillus sp. HB172176]|uniref:hypothetical protein n=1 Tax=Paenibacillus sp. HB172176 TaxID=2493690 RepID=UPI0014390D34|nr:hypothetical protein [Paenibacillus sp. HB172176]